MIGNNSHFETTAGKLFQERNYEELFKVLSTEWSKYKKFTDWTLLHISLCAKYEEIELAREIITCVPFVPCQPANLAGFYEKYKLPRKPKVAIMISGMFRGKFTGLNSLNKYLIKPLEADVFVDTWDIYESYSPGGQNEMSRIFGPEITKLIPPSLQKKSNFQKAYPILGECLFEPEFKRFDPSVLGAIKRVKKYRLSSQKDFIDRLRSEDSRMLIHNGNFNQCCMFNKIQGCFELVENYSKEHAVNYDIAIRIRPDLMVYRFNYSQLFSALRHNIIETQNLTRYGCGDFFAVGGLAEMKKYCALWDKIYEKRSTDFITGTPVFAEPLLASWLLSNLTLYRKSEAFKVSTPGMLQAEEQNLPYGLIPAIEKTFANNDYPEWAKLIISIA